MIVAIGSDHAGFDIKNVIIEYLKEKGVQIIDCGTFSKESTHYPIYGRATALEVVQSHANYGIVVCGTGIGIAAAANKVKGARCVTAIHEAEAIKARDILNANILAVGARITGEQAIINIVNSFLFFKSIDPGSRDSNKIKKLDELISNLNTDNDLLTK